MNRFLHYCNYDRNTLFYSQFLQISTLLICINLTVANPTLPPTETKSQNLQLRPDESALMKKLVHIHNSEHNEQPTDAPVLVVIDESPLKPAPISYNIEQDEELSKTDYSKVVPKIQVSAKINNQDEQSILQTTHNHQTTSAHTTTPQPIPELRSSAELQLYDEQLQKTVDSQDELDQRMFESSLALASGGDSWFMDDWMSEDDLVEGSGEFSTFQSESSNPLTSALPSTSSAPQTITTAPKPSMVTNLPRISATTDIYDSVQSHLDENLSLNSDDLEPSAPVAIMKPERPTECLGNKKNLSSTQIRDVRNEIRSIVKLMKYYLVRLEALCRKGDRYDPVYFKCALWLERKNMYYALYMRLKYCDPVGWPRNL